MKRSVVTECHSLKIIPISIITRFARFCSLIAIRLSGEAVDAGAVPGTVKVTTTSDNGYIKKQISFERSDVSENTADLLERLKYSRLVATYTDETGRERVAGSPNFPLALDYTIGGGVCSVTLRGEDTAPDGFLAV